jgi:hypothetical protein
MSWVSISFPPGTHRKMDNLRSNFYWKGASGDFKYHMVKWSVICRPKECMGLGIINTQILNECLMTKWVWKIYQQNGSQWVRLLEAKYMKEGDLFKSKDTVGSQFWKSLHKMKHLFKWGAMHKVGNGKLTQFLNDVWLTSSPLRICFLELYEICDNKNVSVAKCVETTWQINFRRMLDPEAYKGWRNL